MNYFINGWNWVHFCGGWLGVLTLALFFRNIWLSAAIILLIDLLKEILDSVTAKTIWKGRFGFDSSGFDIKDILMCLAGILIAIILLKFKK